MQRRMFLKSSAGFYLAIPLMESLLSPAEAKAQEGQVKPFLVTMRNGCGREDSKFWQSANGALRPDQNVGTAVDGLKSHFPKMLFVNGVTPVITGNREGKCSHGISASNLLTCGDYTRGQVGMEAAHEESFDHYLHKKWGGIGTPLVAQLGFDTKGKRHRLSWSARDQEIPGILNPMDIWLKLFSKPPEVAGAVTKTNPEAMVQRGSLNAVIPQLREMLKNPRLSASDKAKLDQHLTALNEFEKKLASLINSSSGSKTGPTQELVDSLKRHTGRNANTYTNDLGAVGDLMMDAIALGLGSGATRVATISMGVSIDFVNYKVGKHQGVDFHSTSHANEAGMSEAERHEQLAANDRFFSDRFKRLLDKLAAIPANGDTLLDYGVCQWLCDMGPHKEHGHRQGELMHVVAGGGKIGMAQGQKISYNNNLLMTRFLGTIGNALGAPGENGGIMKDFHATQGKAAAGATQSDSRDKVFTGVAKEMLTTEKS